MHRKGNFLVVAACGLFALFFANVVMGSLGKPVFLADIAEMLLLFTACIVFVIAILFKERAVAEQTAGSSNTVSREE